jgi:hypothetical protein
MFLQCQYVVEYGATEGICFGWRLFLFILIEPKGLRIIWRIFAPALDYGRFLTEEFLW